MLADATSGSGDGPSAASDAAFSLWLKRSGIVWDGLRIHYKPDCGAHVFTAQQYDEGDVMCEIPKSAVLSVLTASSAPALRWLVDCYGMQPDEALNMAVAYERSLGAASKWYGYFCTLPQCEPLPCMWPASQLTRLLAGTGLDVEARAKRQGLASEYQQIREALEALTASSEDQETCRLAFQMLDVVGAADYLHAASLTASRAFFVDEHHGEALVPFADLLNHKPALVPEGAQLEDGDDGDEDEDEDESEEEGESHNSQGGGESAGIASQEDGRIASSARRQAAVRLAARWGVSIEMDTTLHNLAADGDGDGGDDGCDSDGSEDDLHTSAFQGHVALVALRPLPAGAEVFNTYGEHGSRALLSSYGFALASNPLDVAELPWRAVRDAAVTHLPGGARAARARERFLRRHPACGAIFRSLVPTSRATFRFDCEGVPPPGLILALAWLLMPHDESIDRVRDVRAAARELLTTDDGRDTLKVLRRLPWPSVTPLQEVLRDAIRTHASAAFPPIVLASAHSEEDGHKLAQRHAYDGSDAALYHVTLLARAELRIWRAADANLGSRRRE